MRKLDHCLYENKGVDQLYSNCTADQRLCFGFTDSTIPLLPQSEISSFLPRRYGPVCVRSGRKRERSFFSRHGSQISLIVVRHTDILTYCKLLYVSGYNQLIC